MREVLRELVREQDGRERVQTRVLVDEKLDMAEYLLDSDLIAFGAAVESGQLTAYVSNLNQPRTRSMWNRFQFSSKALFYEIPIINSFLN